MAALVNYTGKSFIKLTPGRQITLKVLQEKSYFNRIVRLVPVVLKTFETISVTDWFPHNID